MKAGKLVATDATHRRRPHRPFEGTVVAVCMLIVAAVTIGGATPTFAAPGVANIGYGSSNHVGIACAQRTIGATTLRWIPVDGEYGPGLLIAVRDFQTAQGLTADGIIGPITGGVIVQAMHVFLSDEIIGGGLTFEVCGDHLPWDRSAATGPLAAPAGSDGVHQRQERLMAGARRKRRHRRSFRPGRDCRCPQRATFSRNNKEFNSYE